MGEICHDDLVYVTQHVVVIIQQHNDDSACRGYSV